MWHYPSRTCMRLYLLTLAKLYSSPSSISGKSDVVLVSDISCVLEIELLTMSEVETIVASAVAIAVQIHNGIIDHSRKCYYTVPVCIQ